MLNKMVFQEMLPSMLSPLSIVGAVFYILVYVLIEKMANTTGADKGEPQGERDAGAGPVIRGYRYGQGVDENQFIEAYLKLEQLKERMFMLVHAIIHSAVAIGVISETYHTDDVHPRSSYFVTLHPFLFWYFVVSMFYWKDIIFVDETSSVSFSVIWRRLLLKRYMMYQYLVQRVTIMMLSSDADAYLHMSIGCVILSQELSSACLSAVIIEQLVRKAKPVSNAANIPVKPLQVAVKRRRQLSARKRLSKKLCKNRYLAKCWTYLSYCCKYSISCLKYMVSRCNSVIAIFKSIVSCCLHLCPCYIVFAGMALISFSVRIVLVSMLYVFYGTQIGITKYELVQNITPSEVVAVGIYTALQILWLVDALVIIVRYGDMKDQMKQD
ncbi:uncharacterized protein [Dysidea avara]|uniref:uncharacterized protein n=1 Tax=Dysidea avara TaxID=196820 RepID=UPI003329AB97